MANAVWFCCVIWKGSNTPHEMKDYAASSNRFAMNLISFRTPVSLFAKCPFLIDLSVSIPFNVFLAALRFRNPRLGLRSCLSAVIAFNPIVKMFAINVPDGFLGAVMSLAFEYGA